MSGLPKNVTDALLGLGIVAMASYPETWNISMTELIPKLVADTSINLTMTLGPFMEKAGAGSLDPRLALAILSGYLKTLPHDDKNNLFTALAVLFMGLATLFMGLRMFTRVKLSISGRISRADWTMLAAWTMTVGYLILIEVAGNLCHHVWDLSWKQWRYGFAILGTFSGSLVYSVTNMLVKLSWLFFYWDLAPMVWFRRGVVATGVFVVATAITAVFELTFECKPINGWDHPFDGKCVNTRAATLALLGLMLAGDIFVLILPIAMVIHSLKIGLKEKLAVTAMFAAGILACVAALVRLFFVAAVMKTPLADATPKACEGELWSLIELCLAIMISCIPAIRSFIQHCFPRFMRGAASGSTASPAEIRRTAPAPSRNMNIFSRARRAMTESARSALSNATNSTKKSTDTKNTMSTEKSFFETQTGVTTVVYSGPKEETVETATSARPVEPARPGDVEMAMGNAENELIVPHHHRT